MREVRIGLTGTGYTGKAHAITYAWVPMVFNLCDRLVCEMVAEVSPELAVGQTQAFGFDRSIGDWRALVAGPAIDVVDIYSPNHLHKEMTLEAIRHGEHVYLEKPLALNAHDVHEMVEAAQRARVKTLVGFNYMKNPTAQLVKGITERGEIGEVIHFYDAHNEDYMADPLAPIHWHCFKEITGFRAFDGLAAYIVSMAQYPVGDIQQARGDLGIVVPQRPAEVNSSQMVTVEDEDQAHAVMHSADGMQGVIGTSCAACGRRMRLSYVITGTKGTTSFIRECMAELKLCLHDDSANRQGFRTLLVDPAHPDHGAFRTEAGRGIDLNDRETVEVRDLVGDTAVNAPMQPDFEEGWKVLHVLDAIVLSHQGGH